MQPAALVPELYCSDLEASLRFYVDLLEFTIAYRRPEERFAYLEREGAQLMLAEPVGRTLLTAALEHPFGRGVNLQIEVSDVTTLYERVRASGNSLFLELEDRWYRRDSVLVGNRQFCVQDPDGYLLRFYEALGTKPA